MEKANILGNGGEAEGNDPFQDLGDGLAEEHDAK